MSLPVRIRAEANAELNAAWNWYENQREGLGDDLLGCVDAVFVASGIHRDELMSGDIVAADEVVRLFADSDGRPVAVTAAIRW